MMSFHPQQCQLLRITRKKSPVKASYVIHGHTLAETDTAKYLGVSLHKHSYWSPHVNATAKKANETRAFLQRNLRKAPTAVKMRTYKSLIRPILEYSGVVWVPHTAQDVNKLEMVQRRYARYTSWDSSVTAILIIIGWEPLVERRAKARITMMYRIVHGLVDILASDHIIQVPASRMNGNAQFRVPYAQTLAYQRGFFPDGTCLWNAIPNEVTEAESIDTFKERLSQLPSRPMLRSLQHPVNSHFCTYMHLFPGVVDTFSHTHTQYEIP